MLPPSQQSLTCTKDTTTFMHTLIAIKRVAGASNSHQRKPRATNTVQNYLQCIQETLTTNKFCLPNRAQARYIQHYLASTELVLEPDSTTRGIHANPLDYRGDKWVTLNGSERSRVFSGEGQVLQQDYKIKTLWFGIWHPRSGTCWLPHDLHVLRNSFLWLDSGGQLHISDAPETVFRWVCGPHLLSLL